jgi:hypothetical protein
MIDQKSKVKGLIKSPTTEGKETLSRGPRTPVKLSGDNPTSDDDESNMFMTKQAGFISVDKRVSLSDVS